MELGGNSLCNSGEDQEEDVGKDDMEKMSGSRAGYYECTFCKRGFTNAQALGGHMNIHRKDKSKLKPKQPKSKPSPNQGSINKNFQIQKPLAYNSYMCYYSPPLPSPLQYTSNPTNQLRFHGDGDLGFDLNLQIGSSRTHVYGDHDEEIEENEVGDTMDLELRLGRPSQS